MMLGKKLKYIVYKLNDDNKEIIIDEEATKIQPANDSFAAHYEVLREYLINAKSPGMGGSMVKAPRYAVVDFHYALESGEGTRWVPCHD
jgi:cofilin